MFDSVTISALGSALDGLSERQRATAQNVANVNTPNYRAKQVDFEQALIRGVEQGNGRVTARTTESSEPTRLDGNNVNMDQETLMNVETVLRYQFASRAVTHEFTMLRTAIRTN